MVRCLEDEGFRVVAGSSAPFVLVRPPTLDPESARLRLLDRGVAVRRCDTFPGLDQGFGVWLCVTWTRCSTCWKNTGRL